jgi:maltooligosyltrehalose trehalohydrolase
VALTGETQGYYADFADPAALAKVMRTPYFHDGTYSSFRGRTHGRQVPPDVPGHRFVASQQTHDQVGNRAQGDRLSATLDPGLLACGAAMLLTAPWTPMLFMGEEWGATTPWQYFTDHTDPELGEAVRRGRRAEFGSHGWDEADVPDPQDPSTYLRSRLDWSEPEREPHARLLRWYRDLIRLRRQTPDLRTGRPDEVTWDADTRRFSMRRGDHLVLANLGAEPWPVPSAGRVLLAWTDPETDGPHLLVPPRAAAVVLVG